ncbi:hypothetical protein AURDEDRAFT_177180 [Auricularia subglabra TFB-10046 SS5]|uniref:Ubiquitin-like protease family profile domain-containing protein n=1 Tax=Auricularia subglabra (strain TFB-10046 / SS5) TaxID=717982 RepID=J0LBB2_AURST|nr:hypothetical protein AURDEDRAFT_177180 [Auricularia subglabra TFB-10046 SS5]
MDLRGCRTSERLTPSTVPAPPEAPAAPISIRRVSFAEEPEIRELHADRDDSIDSDCDDSDSDSCDADDVLKEMHTIRTPGRKLTGARDHDAIEVGFSNDHEDDHEDEDDDFDGLRVPSTGEDDPGPPRVASLPYEATFAQHIHAWTELDSLAAAASVDLRTIDLVIDPNGMVPGHRIQPASWSRLVASNKWLNDELVNAGIAVLAAEYPRLLGRFCVLSSYELRRFDDGLPVEDLHRLVRRVEPWTRRAIIVPINEKDTHWLLAVIWPELGYIEVFDSLGRKALMESHATNVCSYFCAVTDHASMLDETIPRARRDWKYRPMVSPPY